MSCFVNGKGYGWDSLRISFLGNPDVIGVTSLNYEETQEKTNLYGTGNRPVERAEGKVECKGGIKLYPSEIMNIQKAAGGKSLIQIPPFDIVVTFNNGVEPPTSDTLRCCQFTKNARAFSNGDNENAQELELVIGKIEWNS
ncbi:MAG: hypothetical protein IPI59_15635 [Sphingobacteriales bacterium]|jgi:hypothetical protein|nr:hypothetical protein [Sphingobacteriales bacterium]MCC7058002.1 hypothetical protein [Chitinophagales bacterium]MDA0199682.1 hypothetical protein [Bacteroidota bacterium]MBK6888564.1 hypothetical protein [Sphingobacteriales bacterium]MBK7528928.1 hypothetical protein [Sphingobacteriales bacterium]